MAGARLSIGVSADAKEASATFKALAKDIKGVGTESVGVTDGVDRVDKALERLARSADTPVALMRNTAKLKVEIDDLRAALEKTPASAEKMKSIGAALAQAESAMDRTIARAGKLKESQEEISLKMGLSAKGAEALAGKLGSANGIMGLLADSSSGLAQGIAKVGFVTMALNEAWKFAKDTGGALAKAIDQWSASQDAAAKKTEDAAVRAIKFQQAIKLAEDGTITLGRSTEDMLAQYDAYIEKTQRAVKASDDEVEAMKRKSAAMKELSGVLDIVKRRSGFKLIDPNDAFMPLGEAEKYAKALADVLAKAYEDGGEEAMLEWAKANQETLDRVAEAFKRFGLSLPPSVQTAYDALKAGAKQTADEIARDIEEAVRKATQMRQAAEAEGKARREATTASEASASAQQKWNDATHDGVTEMNGWVGVAGSAKVVMIEMAEASDQATEALLRQYRASKLVTEEQLKSLDAGKGYRDYLANLKEAYDQGTISLTTFLGLANQLRMQLLQLFGGVTGEAKKGLDDLLASIQALISTAGAGGASTYDASYKGQFERAFGGKK